MKFSSVLLPEYAKNRAQLEAKQKEEQAKAQEPAPGFKIPPELLGKWSGSAHTYKGEIPITLWFKEKGDIHAQLDNQMKTLVNRASFKNGYLWGVMLGTIDTEDAKRRPHDIVVELNLREKVLNGVLVAETPMDQSKGTTTFALSHWVELKKKDSVEI